MKRFSSTLPLFLLLGLVVLAACDSAGDDDSATINGRWHESEAGDEDYLVIDLPDVESFSFPQGDSTCYHGVYQLGELGDDLYEVRADTAVIDTVRMYLENDLLHIFGAGDVGPELYQAADRSASGLRAACNG